MSPARSEASNNSEDRPISMVPDAYRDKYPGCYIPKTVSVGPFHHRRLASNKRDEKTRYSTAFMGRTDMTFEQVRVEIQKSEEEIRKFYKGGDVEPDKVKFIEMIVLDGSFQLEFLIQIFKGDESARSNEDDFRYDFLMLENQLPLIVLKKLFSLALNTDNTSLLGIILHFFKVFNSGDIEQGVNDVNGKHLVDLVRNCLLPRSIHLGSQQEAAGRVVVDQVCSASNLKDDGVTFNVGEGLPLLAISFNSKDRILTMPPLVVDNTTTAHFMNILLYEKYYCSNATFVTAYFHMLKTLVEGEKEANILRQAGIIDCGVNEAKMAVDIIKTLGSEFHLNGSYPELLTACESLNIFHAHPDTKLKAKAQEKLFGSPWRIGRTILKIVSTVLKIVPVAAVIVGILYFSGIIKM